MKRTKTKLVSSIVTLLICFAMLIGSTFAWFTDSASTGVNTIQAGNLDIEVEHQNGSGSYVPVNLDTKLFNDVTLWEPGVVTYENIKIENVGNLAAKIKISLRDVIKNSTIAGNDLTNVIKIAVVEGGFSGNRNEAKLLSGFESFTSFSKDFTLNGNTGNAESKTYGIVLYWEPTENDNLYNLKDGAIANDGRNYLDIQFGLDVVATQNTVEYDSFDDLYDENATYPTLGSVVNTSQTVDHNGLRIYSTTVEDSNGSLIGSQEINTDNTGELVKTIKTTEATSDSTTYDISYTYNAGGTSTPVVAFDIVQTNTIPLSSGLKNVKVTHSHGTTVTPMTIGTAEAVVDGTYYYDESTGLLTIHSKIYSEFDVSYTSDFVAVIRGQGYNNLADAFANVKDDETIVLLKDITTNYGYLYNRDITSTLNLNSFTLKVTGSNGNDGGRAIKVTNGTLTIQNGTIDGRSYHEDGTPNDNPSSSGPWSQTRIGGCIRVSGGDVVLDGLTLYNNDGWGNAVKMESQNHLTIKNCVINSVYGSGLEAGVGVADIYDSTFNQNSLANYSYISTCIAAAGLGTVNIYDSNITKTNGNYSLYIYNSGGAINVYGGEFGSENIVIHVDEGTRQNFNNAYSDFADSDLYDSFVSDHNGKTSCVNISGGKFNGNIEVNQTQSLVDVSISGGIFSSDPTTYVAKGYITENEGNLYKVLAHCAELKGKYYSSVAKAVNARGTSGSINTISLTRDVTEDITLNGYTKLDLAGHTITGNVSIKDYDSINNGTVNGTVTDHTKAAPSNNDNNGIYNCTVTKFVLADGCNRENVTIENSTIGEVLVGNRYYSSGSAGLLTFKNSTVTGNINVGSANKPYSGSMSSGWGYGSKVRFLGSVCKGAITLYEPNTYNNVIDIVTGEFSHQLSASFLNSGSAVREEDDKYIVYKLPVAKVGETTFETLEEACVAAMTGENHKVIVLVDGNIENTINVNGELVFDLNGHTVQAAPPNNRAFYIKENGSLTINDSSVDRDGLLESVSSSNAETICFTGGNSSLTVNGGTIKSPSNPIAAKGEVKNTYSITINGGKVWSTKNTTISLNANAPVNFRMTNGELTTPSNYVIYTGTYGTGTHTFTFTGGEYNYSNYWYGLYISGGSGVKTNVNIASGLSIKCNTGDGITVNNNYTE